MSRDVEVQDSPPLMAQHQEHVQNLEADGWHGEEVERDKLLDVVVENMSARFGWATFAVRSYIC
jgi:hypothetical protein